MNKKTILLVFAMFGLPVVLATLMHSQWLDWTPASTRNHGTLIQPVIQWGQRSVTDVEGNEVSVQTLSGQWHIVLLTDTVCTDKCLQDLYWLRQIRLAQDRHVPEVGLIFISKPELYPALIDEITALSEVFVVIDGEQAEQLSVLFPQTEGSGRFIMDPMANVIMSYRAEQEPDDIRKDLGRLLTWTQTEQLTN